MADWTTPSRVLHELNDFLMQKAADWAAAAAEAADDAPEVGRSFREIMGDKAFRGLIKQRSIRVSLLQRLADILDRHTADPEAALMALDNWLQILNTTRAAIADERERGKQSGTLESSDAMESNPPGTDADEPGRSLIADGSASSEAGKDGE